MFRVLGLCFGMLVRSFAGGRVSFASTTRRAEASTASLKSRAFRSRLLGTPCRTEHRNESWAISSLCRATPSATSDYLVELLGSSPIPRSFVASCVSFQLRLLPSTGVTRLHRYNEPLRHPIRPGLSLASCQLIHTAITAGTSRVAHGPHCLHAVATTPAGRMESVRSYDSVNFGLPSIVGGLAPASPFSGPAQRLLTLRPARSPGRLCDPLHQRLQQSRSLHRCSDCYRRVYPCYGPAPFTTHDELRLRLEGVSRAPLLETQITWRLGKRRRFSDVRERISNQTL